jgi:hypothetical protein
MLGLAIPISSAAASITGIDFCSFCYRAYEEGDYLSSHSLPWFLTFSTTIH